MEHNSDFRYDLDFGVLGEALVLDILTKKKVEVKTDRQTIEGRGTGNIYIEYESRGKPSGIATTQADYWAFVLSNNQIAIFETEWLKRLARKYLKNGSILGGDSNTSRGVLIPIKECWIKTP